MLDHLIKSVPLFWQSELMMPRLLMLLSVKWEHQKHFFWGKRLKNNISKKSIQEVTLIEIKTLVDSLILLFLFYIVFDARAGSWKIIIVVLLASRIFIWLWMLPSPIQSVSCSHYTGLRPFTSCLLLHPVWSYSLKSDYHCPWWEHQGLCQGTPGLPKASTPHRGGAWWANLCFQGLRAALLMHVLKRLYQLPVLLPPSLSRQAVLALSTPQPCSHGHSNPA